MEKNYRIYKKGGYTYVRYNGEINGERLQPEKTLYDYNWGWMTTDYTKKEPNFSFHIEDFSAMRKSVLGGIVKEENGQYGMTNSDGSEFLPCIFDQIIKTEDFVYARKGCSYWRFYGLKDGYLGSYVDDENTGLFIRDGKFGWKEDAKEIIPAMYDDLRLPDEFWFPGGTNFFLVKKNGKYFYINREQEPVLTHVRNCGQEIPESIPFEFFRDKNDIITLQEYIGHEVPEDRNIVLKNDVWQRLDRMTEHELNDIFVNPSDVYPMSEADLAEFNSDLSTEYAAYMIKIPSTENMKDGITKLEDMVFKNYDYTYLVKVWRAVGEEPSAEELRTLRDWLGESYGLRIALAHDAGLMAGETKILVVSFYYDPIPRYFSFKWTINLNKCSLKELKAEHRRLVNYVNKEILPQHRDSVIGHYWDDSISRIEYSRSRKWEDTLAVLEWLKKHDNTSISRYGIYNDVENYTCLTYKGTRGAGTKCKFLLQKIKWMLDNGAMVNDYKYGETALDCISSCCMGWLSGQPSEQEKAKLDYLKDECEHLLLQYDAKTMAQIRQEEALNDDYRIELKRMYK